MAERPPPQPGQVRLYRGAFPDIDAGSYKVRLTQTLTSGGTSIGSPAAVDVHLDVEGPRFALPGPEVHSVFPPANATGSFATRLPHIALKRRTLPWERSEAVANDEPWLALVVLADFEGFLDTGPIAGAFSDGVSTSGLPTGDCDFIEVAESVFQSVFPARADLPYLAHVRQVSLLDAENLKGDLDGWLSVVVANRLPLKENTTYGAYLVSLERQIATLPSVAPDAWTHEVGPPLRFDHLLGEIMRLLDVAFVADTSGGGGGGAGGGGGGGGGAGFGGGGFTRGDVRVVGDLAFDARRRDHVLDVIATEARSVSVGSGTIPADTVARVGAMLVANNGLARRTIDAGAGGVDAATVEHLVTSVGPLRVIDSIPPGVLLPAEPTRRFPVLAHWNFTTTGRRDFQALMEGLDVGLMTSVAGATPPVEPTGHATIARARRDGAVEQVYYRGPLVPAQTTRRDHEPRFTSDAALAVTADPAADTTGLPTLDVSEASAFEIGRLLALSDPAFLEALARWRRSSFRLTRRTNDLATITSVLDLSNLFVDERLALSALARLVQLDVLHDAAQARPPVVDPVEHLGLFDVAQDVTVIARAFGMAPEQAAMALAPGLDMTTTAPGGVFEGGVVLDDTLTGRLRDDLRAEIGVIRDGAHGLDTSRLDLRRDLPR